MPTRKRSTRSSPSGASFSKISQTNNKSPRICGGFCIIKGVFEGARNSPLDCFVHSSILASRGKPPLDTPKIASQIRRENLFFCRVPTKACAGLCRRTSEAGVKKKVRRQGPARMEVYASFVKRSVFLASTERIKSPRLKNRRCGAFSCLPLKGEVAA